MELFHRCAVNHVFRQFIPHRYDMWKEGILDFMYLKSVITTCRYKMWQENIQNFINPDFIEIDVVKKTLQLALC